MKTIKINFLFLCALGIQSMLADHKTSVTITTFKNDTNDTYVVYKCQRPIFGGSGAIFVPENADWSPILILQKHETGYANTLIRDKEGFGVQLKLEPKATKSGAPTLYIKGGLKMSGDCGAPWWHGPFALEIADSEDNLLYSLRDTDVMASTSRCPCAEKNKITASYDAVKRPRYCVYHDTELSLSILPDGIQVSSEHNGKMLDDNKIIIKKNIKV